ncbi:hypothetical protein QQ045_024808 [Rhodiola kirilowii]
MLLLLLSSFPVNASSPHRPDFPNFASSLSLAVCSPPLLFFSLWLSPPVLCSVSSHVFLADFVAGGAVGAGGDCCVLTDGGCFGWEVLGLWCLGWLLEVVPAS